jgi:DNA polymerase-1
MKLYLLDALAILYRSHYSTGHLKNSKNQTTGALFGFLKILIRFLEEEKNVYLMVVWDSEIPTFRKDLDQDYKAHRKPMPDDLKIQVKLLKDFLTNLGVPQIQRNGYEADDVVASLAIQMTQKYTDLDVLLVGSDKDYFQIVSKNIKLFSLRPKKKSDQNESQILGLEFLKDQMGLSPEGFRTYLALCGDASDNVQGVKGVGHKTAEGLAQRYEKLTDLFEHLHEIESKRVRGLLEKHQESAFKALQLVTLKKDLTVPLDLEGFKIVGAELLSSQTLVNMFQSWEFFSLLPKSSVVLPEKTQTWLQFESELKKASEKFDLTFSEQKFIAFDLETTGLDFRCDSILAFGVTIDSDKILSFWGDESDLRKKWEMICQTYQHIPFVAHNAKFDVAFLKSKNFVVPKKIYCTLILRSLVLPIPAKLSLKELIKKDYGVSYGTFEDLKMPQDQNEFFTWCEIPENETKLNDYLGHDIQGAWLIWNDFSSKLDEQSLLRVYDDLEMPFLKQLVKMEQKGVKIDEIRLDQLSAELKTSLEICESQIFQAAGTTFNLKSPKQLGVVLFETLNIQDQVEIKVKKTRTGQYQTHKDFLVQFQSLPLVKSVLQHRELTKLHDTYTNKMGLHVHPQTKRIHAQFHQAGTITGRLSSSNPNLQNIPVKGYWGEQIRSCFCSEEGFSLVVADYSQIELRVLAHLSKDESMVRAFQEKRDIHRETAAKLFQVPYDEVTDEQRSRAKTINFGLLFGMSAPRLAREQNLSFFEAKQFIENYFQAFPSLDQYRHNQIQKGLEQGFVTTLWGRRRDVSPMKTASPKERKTWENICVNTPVQGTESEIVKLGMIAFDQEVEKIGWKDVSMILQVHDEIVVECPSSYAQEVAVVLEKTLKKVVDFSVPLEVDVGIGRNWYEAKHEKTSFSS